MSGAAAEAIGPLTSRIGIISSATILNRNPDERRSEGHVTMAKPPRIW